MRTETGARHEDRIRGVVLDWAGTTVDHGCFAPLIAMVEGFGKHGVELTIEEARGPMGLHKRDHIRALCEMPSVSARWQEVHGAPPTEDDADAIFAEFLPLQCQVVKEYADPIPGCLAAIAQLRERGIAIGSSTGYPRQVMDVLHPAASAHGYAPDAVVCANEVAAGRPAPWMCFRNAELLNVYPMHSLVKVGDTASDIQAGRNASMWTVAIAATGNALGLSRRELAELDGDVFVGRMAPIREEFRQLGAHVVVDSIRDLPAAIEEIERRLHAGERP